jgi:hypothetical protein
MKCQGLPYTFYEDDCTNTCNNFYYVVSLDNYPSGVIGFCKSCSMFITSNSGARVYNKITEQEFVKYGMLL